MYMCQIPILYSDPPYCEQQGCPESSNNRPLWLQSRSINFKGKKFTHGKSHSNNIVYHNASMAWLTLKFRIMTIPKGLLASQWDQLQICISGCVPQMIYWNLKLLCSAKPHTNINYLLKIWNFSKLKTIKFQQHHLTSYGKKIILGEPHGLMNHFFHPIINYCFSWNSIASYRNWNTYTMFTSSQIIPLALSY